MAIGPGEYVPGSGIPLPTNEDGTPAPVYGSYWGGPAYGEMGGLVDPQTGAMISGSSAAEGDVRRFREKGANDWTNYAIDRSQSDGSRGYQTGALDLLHDAATGRSPSQAELLARRNAQTQMRNATALAGSVKGGPGARIAAMRNAGRLGMQAHAEGAQRAEEMRAKEMHDSRMGLMQGSTATRGQDIGLATDQARLDVQQKGMKMQNEQFYEKLASETRFGALQSDQNAQRGENQMDLDRRRINMAEEQQDWEKLRDTATVGAGIATGGTAGATRSDMRSKDVYVPMRSDMVTKDVIYSDDKAKLAKAWDEGHSAAISDVQKVAQLPPEHMKALGDKPAAAAVRNIKADAWDEGYVAPRAQVAVAAPVAAPPAQNRVQAFVAKYGDPALSVLAGPFAPAATDKLGDYATSDERAKVVVDLDDPAQVHGVDLDDHSMRDGASDMRVYNADKSFHRDTPAEQRAVKRGVEDKAGRDADAMMAGFGKSLELGPVASAKDDTYVPDAAMFAAMKSMKPILYAYKDEYRPPGQAPGELQAGPSANEMEKNGIAGLAIEREPETGLRAIDRDKGLKLAMSSTGILAEKVEKLEERLGDKKKKRGRK